ncbi:unnamed protein product [Cylicocyclus nassatus]|uniref:BPI1 domain-containing protein n=1 Tax=Cylicocyclus nassatus TaxID=53992 RepID=A0AA36DQA7_CYLNA|nr:unnamed protein product [Cylicocyclus nassatus]
MITFVALFIASLVNPISGAAVFNAPSNDTGDVLALTISPQIWQLLVTNEEMIKDAVNSIEVPEINEEMMLTKYRIWNVTVEEFSFSNESISFKDMKDGVRLIINDVLVHVGMQANVQVGKRIFGKWVKVLSQTGDISVLSKGSTFDVALTWSDFKFRPSTKVHLNLDIKLTKHLRIYNLLTPLVEKTISFISKVALPIKVKQLVEKELNPRLQRVKQLIKSNDIFNVTDFDDKWAVQLNVQQGHMRVALKPKSMKQTVSPVVPINKVMCVNTDLRLIRSAVLSEKQRLMTASKAVKSISELEFDCLAPQFKCRGFRCQFCTDIEIVPAETSEADLFYNCLSF